MGWAVMDSSEDGGLEVAFRVLTKPSLTLAVLLIPGMLIDIYWSSGLMVGDWLVVKSIVDLKYQNDKMENVSLYRSSLPDQNLLEDAVIHFLCLVYGTSS